MPKRKRDDSEIGNLGLSRERIEGQEIVEQRKRADRALRHGQKELCHALKIARGTERQKLGRRHKQAKSKPQDEAEPELKRIDAEIETVKNLDIVFAAEAHLFKTVSKIKRFVTAPGLPHYVLEYKKPTLDAATANVTARLYKSKLTKECMSRILASLDSSLGLASSNGELKKTSHSHTHASQGESEADSFDWEVNNRLASLSRSPSPSQLPSTEAKEAHQQVSKSTFLSSLSSHQQHPPLSPAPSFSSEERPTTGIINEDGYGGYISDSASSASDLDNDERFSKRRNRRGQRARQQIWEKKYGAGAKHIREEQSRKSRRGGRLNRDEGWDSRHGAQPSTGTRKIMRHGKLISLPSSREKGEKSASDANSIAIGGQGRGWGAGHGQTHKQATNTQKGLHPSWEAAKRAKEKKAELQQQSQKAFQGKKVVFD